MIVRSTDKQSKTLRWADHTFMQEVILFDCAFPWRTAVALPKSHCPIETHLQIAILLLSGEGKKESRSWSEVLWSQDIFSKIPLSLAHQHHVWRKPELPYQTAEQHNDKSVVGNGQQGWFSKRWQSVRLNHTASNKDHSNVHEERRSTWCSLRLWVRAVYLIIV